MMGRMGTDSFSHRDRFASGLTSVMRDQKLGMNSRARREKLLGLSAMAPDGQNKTDLKDLDDLSDLVEEDMWATDSSEDQEAIRQGLEGFAFGKEKGENGKVVSNGRWWLGIDKGSFAEGGFQRGLSALSSLGIGQNDGGATNRMPTASRMIRHMAPTLESRQVLHQSAPVNVPDWSKILGSTEKKNRENEIDPIEDENEEEDERLPPHELLARECARSQMTTFSVCEGAGRTLKGRDLRRVRNAVLKQTGFLDL